MDGTSGIQTFKIDGNSTGYAYGETEDGEGHVVWGASGHNLLYGVETLAFNDKSIELNSTDTENPTDPVEPADPSDPTPAANRVNDVASEMQFLDGTDAKDVFVIDGTSSDYGWGKLRTMVATLFGTTKPVLRTCCTTLRRWNLPTLKLN